MMKQSRFKGRRAGVLALSAALALSACKQSEHGGAPPQQAPVVGVVTVQPAQVTLSHDLPGRLESSRTAQVRAQVGGIVQKRLFEEGGYVRAGQPLYQLDDAVYGANLQSARAGLASAQAGLAKADADLARYRPLVEADAISKQDYDAAVAAQKAARAAVDAARAGLRSAQINVNRSRITAPIAGFIGQSQVSEGTLLSANDATVLVTIRQTDPMHVNLSQSAAEAMRLRQRIANGSLKAVNGAVEAEIMLDDGSVYAHKARLLFTDPSVDESTGQVALRAEVPNPDNILMSGLYVRVRLPLAQVANAFVVPQQAVTRGSPDMVMVVTADGSLQPKPVTIGGQQGGSWIVTGGLAAGDKVVVDGTMIAGITGAKKVRPQEWQAPGTASAPAPSVQAAASASAPTAASATQAASGAH